MKNGELKSALSALNYAANEQLPIKVSFAIAKNVKIIQDALREFEMFRLDKLKQAAVTKDGKIQTKPNSVEAIFETKEHEDAYNKEMLELMDTDSGLTVHRVTESDFKDIEIQPALLVGLSFMITE